MKIQARLILLVLLATAPIVAAELWAELADRREHERALRVQVMDMARLAAAEQAQALRAAKDVAATIAEAPAIRDGGTEGCSDLLAGLTRRLPLFTGFALVDPAGTIRCSSDPASVGRNLADRPYFQQAMATKAFVVDRARVGFVTRSKILPLASPILGADGAVTGVVVVSLHLERFAESLALPPSVPNAVAALVDASGTIIAHRPDPARWIGQKAETRGLEEGQTWPSGAAERVGQDGIRRIYGYAPLPASPHILAVVGLPTEIAYAATTRLYWLQLGIGALAIAAAAAVAWTGGWLWVVKPLARLREAVDHLADRNRPAGRAGFGAVPEFAEVEARVDAMAEELARREADLQRNNALLSEANERLRLALNDKEVLFREVHHRVKNNIQIVSSLLMMQARRMGPDMRLGLEEVQARLRSMSLVHELLYRGDRAADIDLAEYLRELCAALEAIYPLTADQVRIEVAAEPHVVDLETATPVALIVSELIANALKHAFPFGRRGTIRVGLATSAEGTVIEVADDGIGLEAGRASPKPDGYSSGLGTVLVRSLAAQIGATVEVSSGAGTCFRVALAPPAAVADRVAV
ncbi:MAG TPA: histidine kinase dimerization/phosphoacceptor domain -containing protein [Alphaproteobacteria bacterium]|nr:histidine kinase dimerization/phosphoacceptor domain -containing protein [Alphaproteobacteria bacterium]